MSNIAKQIAASVVLGLFTAGTPAPAAGQWEGQGSDSCPKQSPCEKLVPCRDSRTAVSGSCGGADDNKIRVIYTGRDPSADWRWLCRVQNTSGNEKKSYEYAVYCADK